MHQVALSGFGDLRGGYLVSAEAEQFVVCSAAHELPATTASLFLRAGDVGYAELVLANGTSATATLPRNYTCFVLEIMKLDWAPLSCLRPIGHPSDQELAESLQSITGMLENDRRLQRRLAMIVDMRKAGPLSAPQRRTSSEWMKKNFELYKQCVLGCAFVIDSPIIRGVLTALLWVAPLDMPYEVVGTLDDAVRWAISRFDAERVPVPERLRIELGRVFT